MMEKNNFIFKSADIPIMEYGRYPGSRSTDELLRNGIVILDKWAGPTSHDAVATVKKLFAIGKAGHSGTLDPSVTGVLPVALGNACKIIPALQGLEKEYIGVMHLHKDADDTLLEKAVSKFTGEIRQTPPVRSAVARRERTRHVYSFTILDRNGRDVAFRASVQAGTYIRTLCHQIGREIGGAHMAELRRTRVGRFCESSAVKMHELADAYHGWKESGEEKLREFVLPVEAGVEHLGKIIIRDSAVHSVASGTPVYGGGVSGAEKNIKPGSMIAVLSLKGELVALARAAMTSEEMIKRKGLAAKTDRVIIGKDIYPRMKPAAN